MEQSKQERREKLSPDVTTVLRPPSKFRINLPLPHTNTHRVQMFYKSPVTTLSYEFVFIEILCPQIDTLTHITLHGTSLVWIPFNRAQANKFVHTSQYVHTQAKNKDINMTKCLCGSTQRSIHTLGDTLTCCKGSRGSSE